MIYNEKDFLKAIEDSFAAYKEKGARSTAKLKPIHKFVAETLGKIWGNGFEIKYLGEETTEATVEGKYYPKDIDITVLDGEKPIFCLGIKFITSNYKQNANNYFENMMGETANIQAVGNLPYAQLIILRHETPYYQKYETETPSKIEIINDKDISKYLKLNFDIPQAHRPNYIGILLINIDEKTGKVSLTDLAQSFSKETANLLINTLSIKQFFDNIYNYKDYYILQG
ncbi:MAG: hypothetical protein LBG77_07320 [Dysgonamonadaceae bacterium]|jgi:hypothetical protein|nr:hypothetical protein [Dysgonamonadaceae bacterium]